MIVHPDRVPGYVRRGLRGIEHCDKLSQIFAHFDTMSITFVTMSRAFHSCRHFVITLNSTLPRGGCTSEKKDKTSCTHARLVVRYHCRKGGIVLARSRINRGRARREELRLEAEDRASARATRSNSEQIALLDSRLGLGVGAVRERGRLASIIEEKSRSTRKSKPKTRSDRRKEKAARHRDRQEESRADS